MTTVSVHDAFHEMWGPTQILDRWRPALADGVLIAGGRLPDDAVGAAFYGDLFRHEPADGQLDDDTLRALARASELAEGRAADARPRRRLRAGAADGRGHAAPHRGPGRAPVR